MIQKCINSKYFFVSKFDKIVKSQNSRVLSWWALRLAPIRGFCHGEPFGWLRTNSSGWHLRLFTRPSSLLSCKEWTNV